MFIKDLINRLIAKESKKDLPLSRTKEYKKVYDKYYAPIKIKRKKEERLARIGAEENSKEKYYSDKLVPYKDSPTGKAYVGFAKSPLMPTSTGIGYLGVKLQTANRRLIQCSECGDWLVAINGNHLRTHGLTSSQYKEKFGFSQNTGLISDIQSIKLGESNRIGYKKLLEKGLPRNIGHTSRKGKKQPKQTMEDMNRRGTCPEQLKERIVNYIHRFKKIPNTLSRGISYAPYTARFGSFNNALRSYGLPTRKRAGNDGRVLFTFDDGTVFEHYSYMSPDNLYNLMLKKCPILTNNLTIL